MDIARSHNILSVTADAYITGFIYIYIYIYINNENPLILD